MSGTDYKQEPTPVRLGSGGIAYVVYSANNHGLLMGLWSESAEDREWYVGMWHKDGRKVKDIPPLSEDVEAFKDREESRYIPQEDLAELRM